MSIRKVREEIAEKMGPAADAPCHICKILTPWKTLSDLGRCFGCYRAYCRQPLGFPSKVAIPVPEDHPHAWAHRLAAQRAVGVKLSAAQRDCLAEFEKRYTDLEVPK